MVASELLELQHNFLPPTNVASTRSPCPALNALANHQYIPHNGKNISYTALVDALCTVYNISRTLAHVLAIVGYMTCGKLSFTGWTLDLASLSQQGYFKIAHNASLVHPNNIPSHSPDPALVANVLDHATISKGLSLHDIAHVHAQRLAEYGRPLNGLHKEISLGECGLFWLMMRNKNGNDDIVPTERVKQWLCEERLPDDWWTSVRPVVPVGLSEARSSANMVQQLMKKP